MIEASVQEDLNSMALPMMVQQHCTVALLSVALAGHDIDRSDQACRIHLSVVGVRAERYTQLSPPDISNMLLK